MPKKFRTVNFKVISYIFFIILGLLVVGFPRNSSKIENFEFSPEIEGSLNLPSTGAWNGFNDHSLVLECLNLADIKTMYKLSVIDRDNQLLGSEDIVLEGDATMHTILNKYILKNN